MNRSTSFASGLTYVSDGRAYIQVDSWTPLTIAQINSVNETKLRRRCGHYGTAINWGKLISICGFRKREDHDAGTVQLRNGDCRCCAGSVRLWWVSISCCCCCCFSLVPKVKLLNSNMAWASVYKRKLAHGWTNQHYRRCSQWRVKPGIVAHHCGCVPPSPNLSPSASNGMLPSRLSAYISR